MFKGYIPTKGKRPTESTKGRSDFYTLDAVEQLNEYGGVLADDIILIDIDEQDQADKLFQIVQDLNIKCNIIQTTRGKHFYFTNTDVTKNSIHALAAVGLTIDVKVGIKNTVVPLKIDGVEREFVQEVDHPDDLPKWLKVIKSNVNFANMEEGDGRNQALFTYILTLQRQGFTKDEIRETITLINNYVLANPVEQREIDTILRDDAFLKETFFQEGRLLHDLFAEHLVNEHHVIKINNTLHIYDDGRYIDDLAAIEGRMIQVLPGLTRSKRMEVLAYLEIIAPKKHLSGPEFIVCQNGLLRIEDLTIHDFNPDYISKNKIAVQYNPAARSEVLETTLLKMACGDLNLKGLIEEMVGYTLLRRNELGKCFILTGAGSNGKSTLLDMIKKMIGSDNCSNVSLEELNQRFKTAELFGKMVNVGDDISSRYLDDNSVFKKLVTGETVNVERKGRDPFDFSNYSKLLFSANEVPRVNDTSNGLMRRLVIIPFMANFSKHDGDYDPFIKDKLESVEALESLFVLGINGLKRVLAEREFTKCESVVQTLKEYEVQNNPIISFIDEYKIVNEPTGEIYKSYKYWCEENGFRPLSKIAFSREVCKRENLTTKSKRLDGQRIQIFVSEGV